jgi:hypothetical protein
MLTACIYEDLEGDEPEPLDHAECSPEIPPRVQIYCAYYGADNQTQYRLRRASITGTKFDARIDS